MPGVPQLPPSRAASVPAQVLLCRPDPLAPTPAASGRQGEEGAGSHVLTALGPGQQRFPAAPSRAPSCITSSGSHSGKELPSPWEWE